MMQKLGDVWVALAWGAISSVGLNTRAVAQSLLPAAAHAIALAMSVGAGLLLGAASVQLAGRSGSCYGAVPVGAARLRNGLSCSALAVTWFPRQSR